MIAMKPKDGIKQTIAEKHSCYQKINDFLSYIYIYIYIYIAVLEVFFSFRIYSKSLAFRIKWYYSLFSILLRNVMNLPPGVITS